jgi:hypothetical protein
VNIIGKRREKNSFVKPLQPRTKQGMKERSKSAPASTTTALKDLVNLVHKNLAKAI